MVDELHLSVYLIVRQTFSTINQKRLRISSCGHVMDAPCIQLMPAAFSEDQFCR